MTTGFDISFGNGPVFIGKEGEDIDLYIRQCRFTWEGWNMPQDIKDKAIVTTIQTGLKGAA